MKEEKLGKDAQKCFVPTEKANISIAGVKLKTHRIVLERSPFIHGFSEGGDFPEAEDFAGLKKRMDNPEIGDWGASVAIRVNVFDGKEWQQGTLPLQDIPDEALEYLGPEYYTETLMALKYQFQL